MAVYSLTTLQEREVNPGYRVKFVHSDRMSMGFWEIEAGKELPEHAHPHDQISHLVSGRFEFTMDGETTILEAGDIAITPPHVKHSGRALTDCRVIDVFSPVREDYR